MPFYEDKTSSSSSSSLLLSSLSSLSSSSSSSSFRGTRHRRLRDARRITAHLRPLYRSSNKREVLKEPLSEKMEFELDGSLKEWAKDKPLSILQLDPADRAVLRIA
ncbi:dystonin, partial [Vespula maculifrons]